MRKGLVFMVVLAMALYANSVWAFGNINNKATAVGIGIGVGIGGDAKACAVSNNKNVNKNTNVNKNCNVNVNSIRVKNSNSNSNSLKNNTTTTADNEGISQAITQNYEAARPDHIQTPNMIESRAYFTRSKAFKNKVEGLSHLLKHITSLSKSKAKRLHSGSDDIDIECSILFENRFSTNEIQIGTRGELLGYIYTNQKGADCNAVAMFAAAAYEAMILGGTHIQVIYEGQGEISGGKAWNIGIGTGSSILRDGDDVAVTLGSGIGFGSASASNTVLPALTLAVYFDEAWLSKYDVKAWKHDGFDALAEKEGR